MFKGYKTYIVAGVGVITAAAGYLVGDMDLAQAIQLAFSSILAATVRKGISDTVAK